MSTAPLPRPAGRPFAVPSPQKAGRVSVPLLNSFCLPLPRETHQPPSVTRPLNSQEVAAGALLSF